MNRWWIDNILFEVWTNLTAIVPWDWESENPGRHPSQTEQEHQRKIRRPLNLPCCTVIRGHHIGARLFRITAKIARIPASLNAMGKAWELSLDSWLI